jgi:hypothetical protein
MMKRQIEKFLTDRCIVRDDVMVSECDLRGGSQDLFRYDNQWWDKCVYIIIVGDILHERTDD